MNQFEVFMVLFAGLIAGFLLGAALLNYQMVASTKKCVNYKEWCAIEEPAIYNILHAEKK